MEIREIKRIISESSVQYLLLQFTDVLGNLKGVEVGASRIDSVLSAPIPIDASSVVGRFRNRELDGLLKPDLDTFAVLPFARDGVRGARLICDLIQPDGAADGSCPRQILRNAIANLERAGLDVKIAPEVEFYIFRRNADGSATLSINDASGYFDFVADEPGQNFRREVVRALEQLGVNVHHAHHELSPGQHELDLMPMSPLECADAVITMRFAAKAVALFHGLIATFMPKPLFETAGSGMHLSISATGSGRDAFSDGRGGLSAAGRGFLAGLLEHAEGMCLLVNPLVNSYKRLVPGHEAPTHVYWSESNIEPYIRTPSPGTGPTVLEARGPDPSCNPYLSIAAMLAAGLEGIESKLDPGEPIDKDLRSISGRERARLRIRALPANLGEAIDAFVKDRFLSSVLGAAISKTLIRAKSEEWETYFRQVHPWELQKYLATT